MSNLQTLCLKCNSKKNITSTHDLSVILVKILNINNLI